VGGEYLSSSAERGQTVRTSTQRGLMRSWELRLGKDRGLFPKEGDENRGPL